MDDLYSLTTKCTKIKINNEIFTVGENLSDKYLEEYKKKLIEDKRGQE